MIVTLPVALIDEPAPLLVTTIVGVPELLSATTAEAPRPAPPIVAVKSKVVVPSTFKLLFTSKLSFTVTSPIELAMLPCKSALVVTTKPLPAADNV